MNQDYLSSYVKLEYILISYFRKIQIVHNLQSIIEINRHKMESKSTRTISNNKCLLHVIDLNQAPKFFSHQAFKHFQFDEQAQLNSDIEALKDLILLDIQKRVRLFGTIYYIDMKIFFATEHQINETTLCALKYE